MLNLIAGTKTKTGLEVAVKLNDNEYQRGIKITENQMKEINLTRNTELPQWNYTIYPN